MPPHPPIPLYFFLAWSGVSQCHNFIMRSKSKLPDNPEIDLSFTKKGDLHRQEFRLSVQILRVHSIEKLRAVQGIWSLTQNELCEYFANYEAFPEQAGLAVQQLLASPKLKLIKSDNKIYFGEVDRKRREGRGIYLQRDGKLYEGEFYNNEKSGSGIEVYSNGNLYIGQFLNNKKHGSGRFYWFSLSSRNPKSDQFVEYYEGEWWGGLPDGQGVHQKISGDLFTGVFKNGLKHGQGVEHYGNGDYYRGEYVNGMPQGYGEYIWADQSSYKGDFKQGERSGYGVWIAHKDRIEGYRGHYSNDKKTGYGVYTWDNGWKYKGNFDNDYRNGYGQLYDSEGELQYKGFWENGEQSDREAFQGKEMPFNARGGKFPRRQGREESRGKGDRYQENFFRTRESSHGVAVNKQEIGEYATVSHFGEMNLCRRPEQGEGSPLRRSATAGKNIRIREGKIGTSVSRPLMAGHYR